MMSGLKEKLLGRSSKGLRPGERALPFHLAPAIIAGIGGLMVLAAMFMPVVASNDPNLTVAGNLIIESDPWLLLCSLGALIGTVRYWKVGSSGSANVALYVGFVFFILDILAGAGATRGTSLPSVEGPIAISSPYSAGLGLWTAGVGSLLVAYGGLMMRFPRFGFGLAGGAAAPADEGVFQTTKTCPNCAEKIKAAAKVCRFCHHEFDQTAPV